jgi:methylenetetrahydrofolate dehydrogenase (NADP+) / methenyltetrahydrofolate cyclohydrolase
MSLRFSRSCHERARVLMTRGATTVLGCLATPMATTRHADVKARRLDGARVAAQIRAEVAEEVGRLKREHGVTPRLVTVLVGDDPASAVYVRNKIRTCEELGIDSEHHPLPSDTDAGRLLSLVESLNARQDVDGILVQLPLPPGVDESRVIEAIDPEKDVDGFHPVNVGRMLQRRPALLPCTPAGIVEMLAREGVEIAGRRACVVGRSNIVGRPVAELLLQRDATVTICHSRTRDLPAVTREAEVLVVAIGRAGFIRGEHVRPGATVIDVGMNRVSDETEVRELFGEAAGKRLKTLKERGYTLVGDVHPAEVERVAGRLTPVPGGVGLLTVAMLMKNTITAARRRRLKLMTNGA